MKIKMTVDDVRKICDIADRIQPIIDEKYNQMCGEYYMNCSAWRWLRIQFKFLHPSMRFFNVGEYAITDPYDLKYARGLRDCWHACWAVNHYLRPNLPKNGSHEVTLSDYDLGHYHTIEHYQDIR